MNPIIETPTADPASALACQLLKTGRPDCIAYFYPARYQLVLTSPAQEDKVDLGYSGSRLLERLLQTPGEVVAREELMSHAWADRVVGQGSLNQQIYTLRQVLGDEKTRQIIQTLPRRGYLLNPDYVVCSTITEHSTNEAERIPPARVSATPAPKRGGLNLAQLITCLSLLSTLVLGYLYLNKPAQGLYSSELKMGLLNVRYLDSDHQNLQMLMLKTHTLTNVLEQISQQPVQLIISQHEAMVELLCQHFDGELQTLQFSDRELQTINAAHLSNCVD